MGGETQSLEISEQPPGYPSRRLETRGNIGHRRGVAFQQDSISAFLDYAYPEQFKWSGSSITADRNIHDVPPS
jgi:hypothetical protein